MCVCVCVCVCHTHRSQTQWRFVNRAIDEVESGNVPAVLLLVSDMCDMGDTLADACKRCLASYRYAHVGVFGCLHVCVGA